MQKSTGVALILSVVFPGFGHLYGTDGKAGLGLCIAALVSLPLFGVAGIGAVLFGVLWIYGLATVSGQVEAHNQAIAGQAEQPTREALESQNANEILSFAAAINSAKAGSGAAAPAVEPTRRRVGGADVAQGLAKIGNLRSLGIVDDAEAKKRRAAFLESLASCTTNESLEDFFEPIGKLNAVARPTEEEVTALKGLFERLSA